MIRFRRCKALACLTVLAGSVLAVPAFAACALTENGFVAQDLPIDMGWVTIRPDLPVGAVIREVEERISLRRNILSCDRLGGFLIGSFLNAAQSTAVPGFSDVYATDVHGVGIRISQVVTVVDNGLLYYPIRRVPRSGELSLPPTVFRVQLIKTAEQTGSGRIAPLGRFTAYYADGDGAHRPLLTSSFRGVGTTVITPTCEVDAGSRNIAVNFGNVPNTSFTGVGSRAVNRDFDIRLNCRGNTLAQFQALVGVRLHADQDTSNMPGVLKLSAGIDSAERVGIQIVQRAGSTEREVRFGQSLAIGMTTVGNSTLTLPLRARYVQTQAGVVGTGIANGQATFTIQYN